MADEIRFASDASTEPPSGILKLGNIVTDFEFYNQFKQVKTAFVTQTNGQAGFLIGWYVGYVTSSGTIVTENPQAYRYLTYQGNDGYNWAVAIVQDIGGYGVVNTREGVDPTDYIGSNGELSRPDAPGNNNSQIEIRDPLQRKITLEIFAGLQSPKFRVTGIGIP